MTGAVPAQDPDHGHVSPGELQWEAGAGAGVANIEEHNVRPVTQVWSLVSGNNGRHPLTTRLQHRLTMELDPAVLIVTRVVVTTHSDLDKVSVKDGNNWVKMSPAIMLLII